MERWRGRVALVTGASTGIGRAIAVRLLNLGLHVVGCARHVEGIESIRAETGRGAGQLMVVRCDVSKEEDILAMFARIKASELGGVDICVNNAGRSYVAKLSEFDAAAFKDLLDVNVLGLAICTREALRSMRERQVDDGHIIQVSSILGHKVRADRSIYCSSRFAVRSLTDGLRQELQAEGSGIRVTEICPGVVNTELIAQLMGEEQGRRFLAENPHLESEDLAATVEFILSMPRHALVHDIQVLAV